MTIKLLRYYYFSRLQTYIFDYSEKPLTLEKVEREGFFQFGKLAHELERDSEILYYSNIIFADYINRLFPTYDPQEIEEQMLEFQSAYLQNKIFFDPQIENIIQHKLDGITYQEICNDGFIQGLVITTKSCLNRLKPSVCYGSFSTSYRF